jgi:hypothetical protein
MLRPTPRPVLLLDGVGCALAGALLLLGAGALIGPAGLTSRWPLWLFGALLLLYGLDNLVVARRPGRRALQALASVDVAFALGAGALALIDPTGAVVAVRAGLLGLAVVSLGMGGAKLLAATADHTGERAPVPAMR